MQLSQYNCLYRICLSCLLATILIPARSQTIRGKVYDKITGESLVGATVHLEPTKYYTLVNLDGSYAFAISSPAPIRSALR